MLFMCNNIHPPRRPLIGNGGMQFMEVTGEPPRSSPPPCGRDSPAKSPSEALPPSISGRGWAGSIVLRAPQEQGGHQSSGLFLKAMAWCSWTASVWMTTEAEWRTLTAVHGKARQASLYDACLQSMYSTISHAPTHQKLHGQSLRARCLFQH